MKKVFFAAILLYSGNMAAQHRSIAFDTARLDGALSKAKRENKLVFIDCYTSWCGPCKEMSKYVFTQDSVADFFNAQFINVKLDMEKGEGVSMAKEFHVEAFPTYLLLNSDRKLVYRFVGGMPADSFLAKIRYGMNPLNRVAIVNQRYNAGERSKALLREYIQVKLDGKEISVGRKIADEYFNMLTPQEKTTHENWFLFGENKYALYLSNIHSRTFDYLADHWAEFEKKNGQEAVENKMHVMYRKIGEYCLRGWYFKDIGNVIHPYDKKEFDRYRTQIKSTGFEDKDQLLALMNIAQAACEKDTARVTALMAEHIGSLSAENQQIGFVYFTLFNATRKRTDAHIREVINAVIQSNKNQRLVQFVKGFQ